MEIIIEQISRGHKLIGRHKFMQGTINIGRGYSNDIILSDPHVCAEHIQISFDGEHWLATDLGTVNGSFFQGSKERQAQKIVHSGDIISLGKSQIRIIFPNHPVADSIRFSVFEVVTQLARNPWLLAVNILIFALISAYGVHLDASKELTHTQILVPTVGMTLVFAIWPLLVAIISHFTKHEAHTLTQLGICFLFYNIMWLYDVLDSIISFNSSSHFSLVNLLIALPVLLVFSLLWLNCYIGFHFSDKKRLVIASALTALLFGGNALIALSKKPDFTPKAHYNNTLMTPAFLFTSSQSIPQFIEDNKALFIKVKTQAAKDQAKNKLAKTESEVNEQE